MAFAKGKYAKAISDRSGMEFPYNEMVKEWNGSLVHKSEYEPRHPQDEAKHYSCLLYTSPSPRDRQKSRMPSSA